MKKTVFDSEIQQIITDVEELMDDADSLESMYGIAIDENGIVKDLIDGRTHTDVVRWALAYVRADSDAETFITRKNHIEDN